MEYELQGTSSTGDYMIGDNLSGTEMCIQWTPCELSVVLENTLLFMYIFILAETV